MNKNDLLLQKQQFCDAYERLTTTLGTITEELKVAKTQDFHEHSSKILQKTTNCHFPSLFLSNEHNGIGKDIKIFMFFNQIFIYIPMILPQNGWKRSSIIPYFISKSKKKKGKCCFSRLFPFSSKIPINQKLNSKNLAIWIPIRLSPNCNPSKLIIDQTFVFQLSALNPESEERTLTQKIDLKKFQVLQYKQSLIKECFKSDFELFLTFILLSWPQANIDPNFPNIQNLMNELESNPYFHKFHFDGWNMYYINSIDLKAFIYFPISKLNHWTIYEGIHQMPKRIYFAANTQSNLELLLKQIQWFNNRNVQIHTVF